MQLKQFLFLLFVVGLGLTSCKKNTSERSDITGWKYGDQEWGGFDKVDFDGQSAGPNLVLIPGGTFLMGNTDEDVTYEWNNVPRQVTVTSFYMDETEVANVHYREYLYDLRRYYDELYPDVYRKALPDTLVWREELAFNEPMVENYFRYPGYDLYPVVGISWDQANRFCVWRSNKVNEMLMIEKGYLNPNPEQKGSDVFDTKAYLAGQYEGSVRAEEQTEEVGEGGQRRVQFEDGVMLPSYTLPTEAQWEYAALALHGKAATNGDELITDGRIFPWDGYTARYKKNDKYQGRMLANYKRGKGDYMGVSANLNDNAAGPAEIRMNYPNDFGLYNMAGNVSEWVADVYRPMTSETVSDVDNQDLNSFRGNVFKELIVDEDGNPIEKDSLGHMQYRVVGDSLNRKNYKRGDVRNYRDGDTEEITYESGRRTLISDKSRVIKGGSWGDRLFWLAPGARRFLDENESSKTIGFRCSMVRIGGSSPDGQTDGNAFKRRTKKTERRYDK